MSDGKGETFSLAELAARFGGDVAGDASVRISRIASLETAGTGDISFITSRRYAAQLETTRASAVIVGADMMGATALPRIICDNPYAYYARVCALLNPPVRDAVGVHERAWVAASAIVGEGVSIGPGAIVDEAAEIGDMAQIGAGCYVGRGARIGAGTRLHANSVIYHDCEIGERGIVHSGAVIGADGFGMAMDAGQWVKIPQTGRVIIGNDVEIGANTTIDRGALEDTIVEDDVKLDNQIQIGHNCFIGAHTAIAGCVGIAGSVRIGRYCRIGGSAMIIGHLEIADRVEISAGTLVPKSIRTPGKYTAVFPISEHQEWSRNASLIRHLRELRERVRTLAGTGKRGVDTKE